MEIEEQPEFSVHPFYIRMVTILGSSFHCSDINDKNRRKYYATIQSVRDSYMDMREWFKYFPQGLEKLAEGS